MAPVAYQTKAEGTTRRDRIAKRLWRCSVVAVAYSTGYAMRWRPTARFFFVVLVLAALIGSMAPVNARSGQPRTASRVRVRTYMTGTINPADRDRSTQLADALLETAGVSVDWQPCDGPGACVRGDVTAPSVNVILMSAARPTCGLTASAADGRSATVLVSMPCVADKRLEFQLSQPLRSHPLWRRSRCGVSSAPFWPTRSATCWA